MPSHSAAGLINMRLIFVLMLVWLSLVAASLLWNWRQAEASVMELARMEANSHFEKDLVFRRWIAMQGGVYVRPTAKTPPNPYLAQLKDRDVATTSGLALTLVNPAYMTRQVHELAAEGKGVLGHITSLNPIRPENAPDEWERRALLTFETGAKEALSLERMGAGPYLRFMRPLVTEAPCLQCHAAQGYKVGDVRGGISIAVPFAPFAEIAESQHHILLLGHGLIGVLGLAGLWVGGRRLQHSGNALLQSLDAAEYMAAQEELLLSSLGEGVYGIDTAGKCNFINAYALNLLGFGKDEVIGHDQHRLFHSRKEDGSPYPQEECPIHLTVLDGVNRKTEDAFQHKNGQMFPVSLTVTPMRRHGAIVGAIVVFHDITDRRKAEEQIRQLAYFDTLTGLPNRRMLFDRLTGGLSQAKRFGRSLAIMFIDLDNFKTINDTLGHDVGDELLREVAVRMETCVRSGDTVARQGGDEFIIVLTEIAEPKDAALVAEKILAVLGRDPVRIAGQALQVTSSVGIAVYPVNGTDDVQELLKKADKAMYAAKAAGRNCYRFFAD